MAGRSEQDNLSTLVPWDPQQALRSVDTVEARFSKGFLRCRPEKWFPGFAAQWLPLSHSLGVETRIIEIQSAMKVPNGMEIGFAGSVDGEPISIFVDSQSKRALLDSIASGSSSEANSVLLEYLARRLLRSIAQSWSGPQSSQLLFDTNIDPFTVRDSGAIKIAFMINNSSASIWLGLGMQAVERLDGLWRRQIHSAHTATESMTISLELGQLAVAPSMLVDYLQPGTVVDLEERTSDQIVLQSGDRPWLPARLAVVGKNIGFQIVSGVAPAPALPEGTTRLSVQLCSIELDPSAVAEMSQVGAIYDTGLPLGNDVEMVVNGEVVGNAILCSYEGRFAINVK